MFLFLSHTIYMYIYIYIHIYIISPNGNLNDDESTAGMPQDGAGGRQDGDSPCSGLEGHALWPGES